MFDLMPLPGNLNILIILLTIILPKINHSVCSQTADAAINHDLQSGHFTIIEFLKDLRNLHNYDNVLLMHNKNSTIATIFYSINDSDTSDAADAGTDVEDAGRNLTYFDSILSGSEAIRATVRRPFVAQLLQHVQVPVVQLNELQTFYLKSKMGDNLLVIVQIDLNSAGIQATMDQHHGLLRNLSGNLLHMTMMKVLFLFNVPMTWKHLDADYEDVAQGVIEQLLHQCWKLKILNAIIIMADYQITRTIYRYNPFPVFSVETITIALNYKEQQEIFPNRLGDLLGYKMPIVIGGTDPRIIPYEKPKGELFIGGFVGHFIYAFAQKYNCTLHQPLPYNPKVAIPSQDLISAVRNNTVEWSAAVTFPAIPFIGYSYPYELLNWCFMIPVESDIPGYEFYTLVFKGETYILIIGSLVIMSMVLSAALYVHGHRPDLLDVLCHDDCLRGILGMSFTEITNPPKIVRALYLEICILGILIPTTYNAYYSSYVTKAPKEATLMHVEDVLNSGLKVLAWEPEYKEITTRAPELSKYEALFLIEKNFSKYLELRETFNTDYGYVVPTNKWTIVNEQQKIFTTPLFRQSEKFCLYTNIPMCFPVHEKSVFNALVYKLILETASSGLTSFWMENAFMELIRANKLHFLDLSTKIEFTAMKVEDLEYIFIFLGVMLVIVLVAFAGELVVFHRETIFGWLKMALKKCFAKRQSDQRKLTKTNNVRVGDSYPRKTNVNHFKRFN